MKKIISVLTFVIALNFVQAQDHVVWETIFCKSSTSTNFDNVFTVDMEIDQKGNTYTVGYGEQNSADTIIKRSVIVLKHDSSGNTLGSQIISFGLNSIDKPVKLKYTTNGKIYILVNVSETNLANKCVVYCLDTALVQQWQNVFTGIGDAAAVDMAVDNAGNVVIAGNFHAANEGQNIFIHRINSNFSEVDVTYNNNNSLLDEQVNRVKFDKKGNMVFAGYKTTPARGKQLLLVKYDSLLNLGFNKTYDGTTTVADDYANDLDFDNANFAFVTGKNFYAGIDQAVVLKFDTTGKLVWKRQFPQSAEGQFIIQKHNAVYVAFNGFKMVKYTRSGTVLKSISAPQGTRLNDFIVSSDSSFWMMGRTDAEVSGIATYQGYVIKYNASGTQVYKLFMPGVFYNNIVYPGEYMAVESFNGKMYACARKFRLSGLNSYCIKKQKYDEYPLRLSGNFSTTTEDEAAVSVYPNPVKDILQLYSENPGTATLVNAHGQIEKRFEVVSGKTEVDVSKILDGIYFLIIDMDGIRETKKILIQ